ncbi:Hsp20/alpha crystallin family protein [Patescibacteria group bacterium]|nr:Hsp20/alpha crystallin family protein [Patescibacteria group bacterium]
MKSFFEKLTGTVDMEEFEDNYEHENSERETNHLKIGAEGMGDNEERGSIENNGDWMEQEEGELTIDMYQDPENVIIKTMVAGVLPEDLDVAISRDLVTIKGKREESHIIDEEDYFANELYWGSFSRTITLPTEINIEEAKAEEKHGLLILTLPKTDRGRQTKLKVKSSH